MRFTRVLRDISKTLKPKWTTPEMHTMLGSTDSTTVPELRELYLARVREIHPDTAGDDPVDIEVHELKARFL